MIFLYNFGITWNRRKLSRSHLFILYLHYSHLYYMCISTFTFHFIIRFHQSHSILQNHLCMWCLVTFNEIFFLTWLKGDGVTDVNYLTLELPKRSSDQKIIFYLQLLRLAKGPFHVTCWLLLFLSILLGNQKTKIQFLAVFEKTMHKTRTPILVNWPKSVQS